MRLPDIVLGTDARPVVSQKIPVYGEAWIGANGNWYVSILGPSEVVNALRAEPEYRVWKHVELETGE